jgi:hypothetical protein
VGPPGVDSDDDSHPDRKLPSLLSLKVEPPVEVKEVKLPIALEQALAFKTERAKQIGVQPEDYVKLGEELLEYGSCMYMYCDVTHSHTNMLAHSPTHSLTHSLSHTHTHTHFLAF